MKQTKIYSLLGSLLLSASFYCVKAQVTIGSNATPDANALLDLKNQSDVNASTKGLLLPRVQLTSTSSYAPLNAHVLGMVVYNTKTTGDVTPGYYYNSGSKWIRLADAGSPNNIYTTDGTLAANRTVVQADKTLAFTSTATAGTSHFTVDGTTFNVDAVNNRVGIGTAAPSAQFEVLNGMVRFKDNTSVNGTSVIDFINDYDRNEIYLKTKGVTNWSLRNMIDKFEMLDFGTNGTGDYRPLTILHGTAAGMPCGNVGIGTENPNKRLQVAGDAQIGDAANSNYGTLYLDATNATNEGGQITLIKDKTYGTKDWTVDQVGGDGTSGNLPRFRVFPGTDETKGMIITESGKVGIGTIATPGAKLEVNNGSAAGAIKIVDGTQGAGKVLTSDANGLAMWATPTVASTSVTGTASLSTTSPGMSVGGTNNVLGAGTINYNLINGITGTTWTAGTQGTLGGTGTGNTYIGADGQTHLLPVLNNLYTNDGTLAANRTVAQADKTLAFTSTATTGTSHFTVDGTTFNVDAVNNRIGMGTAAPNATLDVVGTVGASTLDGIIAPRFTGDELGAKSYTTSQTGAIVYVKAAATSISSTNIQVADVDAAGYYYFNGSKWVKITSDDWHTTGNTGTTAGTNFIGTTDAVDLVFKRFNQVSGMLGATNTSFGYQSLPANTTTSNNTAIGQNSLLGNTGSSNIGIGISSLKSNTGANNIGIGTNVMDSNTGSDNIGIGNLVLRSSTGSNNTAIGSSILKINTTGADNTAVGSYALYSNTTGNKNTAIGANALYSNVSGYQNVAVGDRSAVANTGNYNTIIGPSSLTKKAGGDRNIAIGYYAGNNQTDGSYNLIIGQFTNVGNLTGSNQMNIADAINAVNIYNNPAVKIGIGYNNAGTTTPTETLEVFGSAKIGTSYSGTIADGATTPIPSGGAGTISFQNSHFFGWTGSAWKQLDDKNNTIVATSSFTMPSPAIKGQVYTIYLGTTSAVSVNGTIKYLGVTSSSWGLSDNPELRGVTLMSDGSSWVVVGKSS